MTLLPPSTNFPENYFQHSQLTLIVGEPTHETLTMNLPLNQILAHLQHTSGTLTPKQLQAKCNELNQFKYNLSLSVDVVFTPIDDLQKLYALIINP